MANVFSGRPYMSEGAAMAGFGRSMMQAAGAMASIGALEQHRAEDIQYRTETSQAGAAIITEWDNYLAEVVEESRDNPEIWLPELENRKELMRKNILSNATMKSSKVYIANKFNTKFAGWKARVRKAQESQIYENANVVYEVNRQKYLSSPSREWQVEDVGDRLEEWRMNILDGRDDKLARLITPEQISAEEQTGIKTILGHYFLQQAAKSENLSEGLKYLGQVNPAASKLRVKDEEDEENGEGIQLIDENEIVFNSDDIDDLKRRYRQKFALAQDEQKNLSAQRMEEWRAEALIKLREGKLTYFDIDSAPILTTGDLGRQEFYNLLDAQTKDALRGQDILSSKQIEGELETMGYRLASGAVTKPEYDRALVNARYTDRSIDDRAYDELASLGARKFESYQGEAMSEAISHSQGQLVSVGESLIESLFAIIENDEDKRTAEDMKNRRKLELENHARYRKALGDWFAKNPDADSNQIYIQSRKMLAQYRTLTLPEIAQRREQFEKSLIPKKRYGKPAGSAAYMLEETASGWRETSIPVGEYNADGTITLNIAGLRMLKRTTGGDKELARRLIKEQGYVIPEE